MISSIIKVKKLSSDEERKLYMDGVTEAARIYFGIDTFPDETLKLEIFQDLKRHEGHTLPSLRRYYKGGVLYCILVCTDEQLAMLRTVEEPSNMGVCKIPENISEDIFSSYEQKTLLLSEINMFFTETGAHSLRPDSDVDAEWYIKVSEYNPDNCPSTPKIPAVASFANPPSLTIVRREDRFKIVDPIGRSYLLPLILPE